MTLTLAPLSQAQIKPTKQPARQSTVQFSSLKTAATPEPEVRFGKLPKRGSLLYTLGVVLALVGATVGRTQAQSLPEPSCSVGVVQVANGTIPPGPPAISISLTSFIERLQAANAGEDVFADGLSVSELRNAEAATPDTDSIKGYFRNLANVAESLNMGNTRYSFQQLQRLAASQGNPSSLENSEVEENHILQTLFMTAITAMPFNDLMADIEAANPGLDIGLNGVTIEQLQKTIDAAPEHTPTRWLLDELVEAANAYNKPGYSCDDLKAIAGDDTLDSNETNTDIVAKKLGWIKDNSLFFPYVGS